MLSTVDVDIIRYGSTRNFHLGTKNSGSLPKSIAKSGKFLGFWIHLSGNAQSQHQTSSTSTRTPLANMANVTGYTSRLTSRFFRTMVPHSAHDDLGTQLAHAAMGCPAASSHEVPQDLRIHHQRALKFCSNPGSKSAGT